MHPLIAVRPLIAACLLALAAPALAQSDEERVRVEGGVLRLVHEELGRARVYLDRREVGALEGFTSVYAVVPGLDAAGHPYSLVLFRVCGASVCRFDLLDVRADGTSVWSGAFGNGAEYPNSMSYDGTTLTLRFGSSRGLNGVAHGAERFTWRHGQRPPAP